MKKVKQDKGFEGKPAALCHRWPGRPLMKQQLITTLWVSGASIPGRGNSMYKGPEVEVCLVHLRKSKDAVWLEQREEKLVRKERGEVGRAF